MKVMHNRSMALLVALAGFLLVTGCKSKGATKVAEVSPGAFAHIEKPGPGDTGVPQPWDPNASGTILEPPPRMEAGAGGMAPVSEVDPSYEYRVVDRIHFDFDSDIIKPEWIQPLMNNIRWMQDHPGYFMNLEGHCDERGTSEYNLALGERRAAAVRKFMIEKGVEADRLQTTSYGEERPLDPGHTESAWSQNRRVEFLVGQQ